MIPYRFIAIEGNIGAGKTSLTNLLATTFNGFRLLEEFDNNPFLKDFYEKANTSVLDLELYFLNSRIEQLKTEMKVKLNLNQVVIADYHIDKCLIYAQNNLNTSDYNMYLTKFQNEFNNLMKPELLIYLNTSPEKLLQQIKKRGRTYEKGIKLDYLYEIKKRYEDYLIGQKSTRIAWIDCDFIDFVNNPNDQKKIIEFLSRDHKMGITRFLI